MKLNAMSKLSLGMLAFAYVSTTVAKEGDVASHTFFSWRPLFQSAMPEKVSFFRNDLLDRCEDGWGAESQLVFLGSETTDTGSKDLARFFFPFNKTELLVKAGDEAAQNPPYIIRDIDPQHFGIVTTDGEFQSNISIRPKQSVFGIGLSYRQRFTTRCDGSTGFWGEVSFPILRIKNDVRLCENVTNDGGGVEEDGTTIYGTPAVANMTQAFKQAAFKYGRIGSSVSSNGNCKNKCDNMTKWGVGDVEIKLGYDTLHGECCHTSFYGGVVAPTSNRPKAIYLFEPITGANHHFGFLLGGNFGYELWSWENSRIRFELDSNGRYYIKGRERRSFDILDKSWSRYMAVFANADDALNNVVTPGINVFTADFNVSPHYWGTSNAAMIYENDCGWAVEAGYNFFAREAESAQICNWGFQPAFVDFSTSNNDPLFNPARTINHQYQLINSPQIRTSEYIPLTPADINFQSVEHPGVISSTIYGSVGYDMEMWCMPTTVAIGGSYEFAGNNDALTRWVVWGKFVVAF